MTGNGTESEARLRAIVQTAVDGILTIDELGTIETVNPATERIFGYTAAEMVGRNVRMLMPSPYHEEHDAYLDRYRRTGERRIIGIGRDVWGRRKDGSEFPLELAVSETVLPGRRFFTGIVRDITERVRGEEALREAKEAAEAANLAKDQFMAIVSHELRTPLNAIIGYTDLLDAGVYGMVPDGQTEVLTRIRKAAAHLTGIIEQLLSFARGQNHDEELQPDTFQLDSFLRDVAAVLEPLAREKGLRFYWNATPGVKVHTDPTLLRQIAFNLGSNALKFTDQGEVKVVGGPENGTLVLRVSDTGCGIATEHQDRIFEPFWQAEQTLTRRYGGTGLGLSVARRLARSLGGDITVESTVGQGTTFTVRLPVLSSSGA
jgi:PAS domain S-box-containing protein